jgi:hypothetical protein
MGHSLWLRFYGVTDVGNFVSAEEDHSKGSKVAVVLGAGFSIAVNEAFPDTDGLGERVRSTLPPDYAARLPGGPFRDGRFEEWLSYLAERQPHHDEAWTLEANALEVRVTKQIQAVLSVTQETALAGMAPPWFYQLLSLLHAYRASVVSMNYDNLIECGVETMRMAAPGYPALKFVREEDILDGLPKTAVPPEIHDQIVSPYDFIGHAVPIDNELAESFRLMKLHGSLSWYWLPGNGSGSSLRRWQLPGVFGQPWGLDIEMLRRELPRHEVFLVPPSALKGERLQESVARELWHRTAKAIANANRVVFMGYSVPEADRSFSGLLSEGLGVREVAIEIVNPKACQVRRRLMRLGVPEENISIVDGSDCVERWVTDEVARACHAMVSDLRSDRVLTGRERMYVDSPRVGGVVRVERVNESVVLHLDPPGQVADQARRSESFLDHLDGVKSVFAQVDGSRLPVIGYWADRQPNDDSLDQLHMVPAGR